MSAQEIRDRLPAEVWSEYFKFTVVRNPYDKLVSAFFWFDRARSTYGWWKRTKVRAKMFAGRGNPIDRVQGESDVERFRSWLRLGGWIADQNAFMINGECCMDFFIRFEQLQQGIQEVSDRLGIKYACGNVPRMKVGIRSAASKTSDFYDQDSARIVQDRYAYEIEKFGYTLSP